MARFIAPAAGVAILFFLVAQLVFGANPAGTVEPVGLQTLGSSLPNQTVHFQLQLRDDDLRVRQVSAVASSPDGVEKYPVVFAPQRELGNWEGFLSLPFDALPGTWGLEDFRAVDDEGTAIPLTQTLTFDVSALFTAGTVGVQLPAGPFRETLIVPVRLNRPDRKFQWAMIVFKGPKGQIVRQTVQVHQTEAGHQEIPVRLIKGLGPGTWQLARLSLIADDQSIQHLVGGQDFQGDLKVVKGSADTLPPQVESMEASAVQSDTGTAVRVVARVADDVSGVKSVFAVLIDPTGYEWHQISLEQERSAAWSGSVNLSSFVPEGTWKVAVTSRDHVGGESRTEREFIVKAANPLPPPPTLAAVTMTADDGVLTITATVAGDVPARNVSVHITAPGRKSIVTVQLDHRGNEWVRTLAVPRHYPAGAWEIDAVTIVDEVHRKVHLTGAALPQSGSVAYVGTADPDNAAPTLGSLTTAGTAQVGERIRFELTAADDLSGVQDAQVRLTGPDNTVLHVPFRYSLQDQRWLGSVRLPANGGPGIWAVTQVTLTDGGGNAAVVTDSRVLPSIQVRGR